MFTIKQHDTLIPISGTATTSGLPESFSGMTVYFIARLAGTKTPLIQGECDVDGAGGWSYTFQDGDTGLSGTYEFELEGVTAGGQRATWPHSSYGTFVIVDDISNAPLGDSMGGITVVSIGPSTLDTRGVEIGELPPDAELIAFLLNEPVAITSAGANGAWSMNLNAGYTYTLKAQHPDFIFSDRAVRV